VPYTQSWTFGVRRAHQRHAIEVRYVGTHGLQAWRTFTTTEQHRRERVPRRVQAGHEQPAGEHRGRPGARSYWARDVAAADLPTTNALPASQAGDPTNTGANWTNSTFLGFLSKTNRCRTASRRARTPTGYGDATRRAGALTAGLPANFFANPDMLGGANLTGNGGSTRDGLQVG
jgi:hypothetical protein